MILNGFSGSSRGLDKSAHNQNFKFLEEKNSAFGREYFHSGYQ